MTSVIFYEKPGCINNTKQKALLQAAGHTLEARNLLTHPWTAADLRLFFGDLPVTAWFNRTAPLIKSGEVVPELLDAEAALALMLRHPILIRRPLLQVGDRRSVGFDLAVIDAWIGLTPVDGQGQAVKAQFEGEDVETCPRSGY